MSVRLCDVALDRGLQIRRAGEGTAFQTASGQNGEPALDQVQPGRTCRGEMQLKSRMLDQPVMDQLRLVRLQVVEHKMHRQVRRNTALDLLQELAELDAAMTWLAAADHGAGLYVERCEQVEGAMPAIIVRHVHGLDLGLLVHAQHQRAIGWCEVQANDIAHLLDESRIGGELERVGLMWAQAEGAPDPRHRSLAHACAARHPARAPVRGVGRRLLQCEGDQALNRPVIDAPRGTGAGGIDQSLQPMRGEASTPQRHGLAAHLQSRRDAQIGGTWLRTGQDDAQALSQCLTGSVPPQQALQRSLLALAEIQRDGLGSTRHGAPPGSMRSTLLSRSANALTFLTQTTRSPSV